MNLHQKVQEYISSQKLFSKGDTIMIGVSGGADSITLLHILCFLQYKLGIQLQVAHFNHKLRKSADADEAFVRNEAERLNIPFVSQSWNHRSSRAISSLEEKAREARLQFFAHIATKSKATIVALAHTEDDQAETVLMRIFRGSGLQGLRGILPQTTINGVTIIRPLLTVKRTELLAYLKKNKIAYRRDPTNQNQVFFRNRVRLKLLPLLAKEFSPQIKELLSSLAQTTQDDYAFLEELARKNLAKVKGASQKNSFSLDLEKLKKRPISQQRMLIRLAIETLKGNTNLITWKHMQEIEDLIASRPIQSIVDLPGKIKVKKTLKSLILCLSAN